MIKYRPKLGDINEILSEIIDMETKEQLLSYLEERSFVEGELRFAKLEDSLMAKSKERNPSHWETHIVMFDGRVIGYSDGILEEAVAV